MDEYYGAAVKLYEGILRKHWDGKALTGPDPGVRFSYRIGRFIKSYLRKVMWHDNYYYLQAQGYWVLSNWVMFNRSGNARNREIAIRCSNSMLARQREDGAWDYPNPEWKGRVATVEGTWGSIGLLETYRYTNDAMFLGGALRWHEFMMEKIGLQRMGDELSINYFAGLGDTRVPNNSTTVLSFLAELGNATGESRYLGRCRGLLKFIQRVQMPSGELPYAVGGASDLGWYRAHFQCYQYNAFECLSLLRYYQITQDVNVGPIITKLLDYLSGGLAQDGHAFYDCRNRHRIVTYHTAALGAAFTRASQLGFGNYDRFANRAYAYVLSGQKENGGFVHSQRDYGVLSDKRSYPRYLSMMLYHLLLPEVSASGEYD